MDDRGMKLIIIAGMPSAGKSTIAKKIGAFFGYPILEKDDIKEELFDTLGYGDRAEKRKLDVAATAVLMRCAESVLSSGESLIIVNNFRVDMKEKVQRMVDRCGCHCVTVFLTGDADVFYTRYVERDQKRSRHLGHTFIDRHPPLPEDDLNVRMSRKDFADIFEKQGMADFKIKGPRIEVDATHPEAVDADALIHRIREAL